MKQYRIAFAGFRHAHIFDLYRRAQEHPRFAVAATCEEDVANSLLPGKGMEPDFTSFAEMLDRTPCDVIALGGCYGHRGELALRALASGRHVIADKPLCISLPEFERIEKAVWEGGGRVGLMLDLRDNANLRTLREIIMSGVIGRVQTIAAAGQHPLLSGQRPAWYFQPGLHGGTINDIGIHLADLAPWLVGSAIDSVLAARTWNSKARFAPHFEDCAQFMLRLADGTGVLADVSYLAPDGCGYTNPDYWRIAVHGTGGMASTSWNSGSVTVAGDADPEPRMVTSGPGRPGGYLEDFLGELDGADRGHALSTSSCLAASRWALEIQTAASPRSTPTGPVDHE